MESVLPRGDVTFETDTHGVDCFEASSCAM